MYLQSGRIVLELFAAVLLFKARCVTFEHACSIKCMCFTMRTVYSLVHILCKCHWKVTPFAVLRFVTRCGCAWQLSRARPLFLPNQLCLSGQVTVRKDSVGEPLFNPDGQCIDKGIRNSRVISAVVIL